MDFEKEKDLPAKNRNVFYVGLLSFFGGISQDIFSPILPIYLTAVLGFDKTIVGIAEGTVTASVNIFRIVSGFLSDKIKKQKPIIFLGYFLSMVARPLLVFFTSLGGVIFLRLLDGIGKGIKDPPKDVLVAGSSAKSSRGKNFGIARMFDTLGSVAGPLLLFLLLYIFKGSGLIYHYILIFSALPLIATLLIVTVNLKENKRQEERQKTAAAVYQNKAEKKVKMPLSFYIFLAIMIVFTLGNSSDAFLILRAKSVGVAVIEIPLIIALFNLVYALSSVPFGSLSDKIGRIPTLSIGWMAFSLVYLGFAISSNQLAIWILYAFYGIYYAANEGVSRAFLADMVSREYRGRAFGVYGMAVGLATLPASLIAGLLWDRFSASMPFYFGSVMAFLSVILLIIFSKKLKVGWHS